MSAAKHTPGPWFAEIDNPRATIPGHTIKQLASPHLPVAIVHAHTGSKGPGGGIANAHLVAAAPALLAALELANAHFTHFGAAPEECDADVRAAWSAIRAAIKAAKGGK